MAKEHPTPIGANLTPKQIDELAKTMFNRYHYRYGFTPQYNDACAASVRKTMNLAVKQVLDVLDIHGYKLTQVKGREDVGREFLTKSTVKSS